MRKVLHQDSFQKFIFRFNMIKDDVHMEMQNDGNRQVRIVLLGRSLFQAFCSLQNYELAFDLVSVLFGYKVSYPVVGFTKLLKCTSSIMSQ